MNCYKLRNVRAVTIVAGLFSGVLTMGGRKGLNWFEAQERCHGRGLTTETRGRNNQAYWTGRYIRLSPWIKILGCYPDSNITNQWIETVMDRKSVGACQEICKNENSTTFAVKLKRCTCLKGQLDFGSMYEYSPSHCNYKCDSIDGIYSGECGGETAHNVFISDQGDSFEEYQENRNCLSLQCTTRDPIYLTKKCSDPIDKICQTSTSITENAIRWNISMERCKNATSPSYLNGNLDLTNASESCQTLPRGRLQVRWIGIARQKYEMKDQGSSIEDDERKYFHLCQQCRRNDDCKFIKCTKETQNEAFCSNRITTESTITNKLFTTTNFPQQSLITKEIATSTRPSNQTNEKETTTLKQTTTTSSNHQWTTIKERITTSEKQQISVETNPAISSITTQVIIEQHQRDDEGAAVISIPIILGIVFTAIVIVLSVMYVRRRNLRRKMDDDKKPPKLDGVRSAYSEADNLHDNSYFVIEKPPSNELADNSALDSESPYSETEEGDYDHLRNKDSRKKDVDDTYQHAPYVINGDISHYDSTTTNEGLGNTGRIINRSKNNESPELKGDNSTYSEVDNIPDSAYFVLENLSPYELADNSVIDSESPYNEAEEGDYDHLRNKGSRKKDVEDTYQHATFDSSRDISDYDTSANDQKQEFESTYDHMHESLNLNRNSDYGYNSIDPNIHKEPTYDKQ